jgi:predicted HAD superfamily Cof-like phosphohydrolase
MIPLPGSPQHDEFVRRARDPNSHEAAILRKMVEDSSKQTQDQVRRMLQKMIELAQEEVPGQLFRDVSRFHEKFGLEATTDPGHALPDDVLKFRIKFMLEELHEYVEALGMSYGKSQANDPKIYREVETPFNVEKAFDALIDLAYVALGTAYLHRFPFDAGWARVQGANMKKVRAESADDPRSIRKHKIDVVKPEGWEPASLVDLL